MKNLVSILILSGGLLAMERSASGQFWAATGAPLEYWSCVASSADGTRLVAAIGATGITGGIYTSTNSGATWTQATNAPLETWTCVASSADGTRLIALNRPHGPPGTDTMFISGDSGTTWTQVTDPTLGTYSHFWTSAASSADGTILVAADNVHVYTSTNSGAAWTQANVNGTGLNAVASSVDGTKLFAAGAAIYTSANSGVTWTLLTNAPGAYGQGSIASSADGTKLAVVNNSLTNIYLSTDSGFTWTPATNAIPADWSTVISSADGTRLVVSINVNSSVTIISTNSGATWTSPGMLGGFGSLCCSADGDEVLAVVATAPGFRSGVEILQAGEPPLSIAVSGTNILLSWSGHLNANLQQNPDLTTTSWVDVTASPALVNDQFEIIFSPTNNQDFYRLRSR